MADEEMLALKYSKSLDFTSHFTDGSMVSTLTNGSDSDLVQIVFFEAVIDPLSEMASKGEDGSYKILQNKLEVGHARECRVRLTMTQKTAKELQSTLQQRFELDKSND